MGKLLKSRKFTAIIVGVVATLGVKYLKLDPETAQQVGELILYGILAYIGGTAIEDAGHKFANGKNGNSNGEEEE